MSASSSRPTAAAEIVRVPGDMRLVRVHVEPAPAGSADVALVLRSGDDQRRLRPLPTPRDATERVFAFGLQADDRTDRMTLLIDGEEIHLPAAEELTARAAAERELERARARTAQLERLLGRDPTVPGPNDAVDADGRTAVLEQQLVQHRRLRAQLARELDALRARESELDDEMGRLAHERDELAGQLEVVRAASEAARTEMETALGDARERVAYLERRLIELQARRGDEPAA